jgi:hypothetical protein
LKRKDDEFVKTLKRQAEDIDTLLQYMSRQFVEVQNTYKDELEQIEAAFLQVCGHRDVSCVQGLQQYTPSHASKCYSAA